MKAIKIIKKILKLLRQLAVLNKELEAESGSEWLTINAIKKAIDLARTAFEQRLNNKENKK